MNISLKTVSIIQLILLLSFANLSAQVGIGTTSPDASSVLDIVSTNSGLLIPRMTEVQKNGITSPVEGLLIYQLDNGVGFYYYTAGAWQPLGDKDWTMHSNGADMFNANTGNVGIGTNAPTKKLHIEDASGGSADLTQDFETAIAPFGGDWLLQTTNVNGGSQAAKSKAITDSQSSSMTITVNVPTASTVSFYRKVSSESCCDKLKFYIDGAVQGSWGGVVAYSQVSYPLTTGTHTLEWRYEKDYSISSGDDAAYVDDIVITNAVPASALRIVDGSEARGKVLMSDTNGNASWQTISSNNISDVSTVLAFQGMEIPICGSSSVGDTGNFTIDINGVSTTVSWEILQRQGTTVVNAGDPLVAPLLSERLQVKYDFSPALPFIPTGMALTASNNSAFPDVFSVNYAAKSDTSITVNIARVDSFGNPQGAAIPSTGGSCWGGQFYFDVILTK